MNAFSPTHDTMPEAFYLVEELSQRLTIFEAGATGLLGLNDREKMNLFTKSEAANEAADSYLESPKDSALKDESIKTLRERISVWGNAVGVAYQKNRTPELGTALKEIKSFGQRFLNYENIDCIEEVKQEVTTQVPCEPTAEEPEKLLSQTIRTNSGLDMVHDKLDVISHEMINAGIVTQETASMIFAGLQHKAHKELSSNLSPEFFGKEINKEIHLHSERDSLTTTDESIKLWEEVVKEIAGNNNVDKKTKAFVNATIKGTRELFDTVKDTAPSLEKYGYYQAPERSFPKPTDYRLQN